MADQDSLSKLLEWGSGILSTAAFFFGGRAFQVHDNLGTRIGELEKSNVTRAELDSDLHDWTKIVGLYSKYVVKGDPVPSNYPLPDVNMVLRTVTKVDIDNLFEAGKTQIDNAVSKLASLLESVNTATTVEAVKLINW